MTSCSKDEWNLDVPIPGETTIDTIIVDDKVVLSTTAGNLELSGVYAQCLNIPGFEGPNEYTHLLAYANGLVITGSETEYNGPLYLLYWTSSTDIREGRYLVEGVFYDPNDSLETNTLYDLTITAVNDFSIEGFFEALDIENMISAGEFKTARYSCEELGIEEEEFVEYADGRMTLTLGNEEEKLLMSAALYCEDIFVDKPGQSRIIWGGGAFLIDSGGELNFDEIPEMMIVFDMDDSSAGMIGTEFKAYFLNDLDDLLNSNEDPTYAEVIAQGSEVSITLTSETATYLEGTYIGLLKDGRKVEGRFRANIAKDC